MISRTAKIVEAFARLLQLGVALIFAYSIISQNWGLAVNSGIPLLISLIPDYIGWRYNYSMGPVIVLWISLASFLHSLGAWRLYDMYGWYDQVAHGVSGSVVAGIGYGIVRAMDEHSSDVDFPGEFRFLFILIIVLAFGVAWEIMEFGLTQIARMFGRDPLLAQYGVDDIVYDLALNAVGAVIVGIWGTKYYGTLSGFLSRRDVDEKMK